MSRLRSLATSVSGALPGADELAALDSAELAEATQVLGDLRNSVGDAISLLAAAIERQSARALGTDGLAQQNGFSDGAGFVQELTGVGRGEARRLIRIGDLLETAEAVAPAASNDATDAGEPSLDALTALPGPWDAPIAVAVRNQWLSASQGDALRQALRAPRIPALEGAWRDAALSLIADCWSAHWSPEDLAKSARQVRASLDALVAQSEAEARHRLRSLRRFVRASGMVHYDIELDPESDARFYGPIRRILSPRFGGPRFVSAGDANAARELADDPRTNEQLQVDTLVDLIDRAVSADDNDLFKTGEPQVMVAVTATDLAKAHAEFDRGYPADDSAGGAGERVRDTALVDHGVAWIDGSEFPITATDALRMICASGFTPLLFDETGRAIDVGKDQRFFTRRQRRAMAKRDGGCMYPGCVRPPGDCESHHLNPWAQQPQNHTSEVDHGVLLCRRHHKMVHDFGARIERRASDFWLLWPRRDPRLLHSKSAVIAQLRAQGKVA